MSERERQDVVVQEVCAPPEVTVDSFYDHDADWGFAYCRERLEVKSGVCTKARLFEEPELASFARSIARGLKQKGSICFQAMRSAEGWCVTDLNLRTGAGTALTCAAGFDVISAAYACRRGEDYARFVPPLGGREIFVTRQYAEFVMAERR